MVNCRTPRTEALMLVALQVTGLGHSDSPESVVPLSDLMAMFTLGLLGTGHCVGMCGPLVVGLPGGGRLSAHLFYNLGRMLTYVLVGSLLAALGGGLGAVTRLQMLFSLLAAVFLLAFGLMRLGVFAEPRWMHTWSPAKLPGFGRVASWQRSGQAISLFPFGLMMGLLPCGLSFAAFSRALAAPGPIQGALLVGAFALGTLPGLLAVGTAAAGFARKHQAAISLLSGLVMIGMAAALILDALGSLLG